MPKHARSKAAKQSKAGKQGKRRKQAREQERGSKAAAAKAARQRDAREARRTRKAIRRLERRLDDLRREQRRLAAVGSARVGDRAPVVSLDVPLETDDPAAPLWATVSARLPEEVTTVGDDGRIVRYRYSPVGSTPQAPRYRRLADSSEPPGPEAGGGFPG